MRTLREWLVDQLRQNHERRRSMPMWSLPRGKLMLQEAEIAHVIKRLDSDKPVKGRWPRAYRKWCKQMRRESQMDSKWAVEQIQREAVNVYQETGNTPRELVEQRNELRAACELVLQHIPSDASHMMGDERMNVHGYIKAALLFAQTRTRQAEEVR